MRECMRRVLNPHTCPRACIHASTQHERLQNRAARIITGNFDYINVRGIDTVKTAKMD